MRFPARIKKGMASNVKLVVEAYILWGSIVKSDPWPKPMKNTMAVRAIATAMGILIRMSTNKSPKISNVSIL
jgi:cytochrome c oxidase assembly factor CtaG